MAHELWLVKGKTMTNLTMLVGTISWRSNVDELGDQLSFDFASNARHFPKSPVELGDLVILKNGSREVTRGIVVDESKGGDNPIAYSAFDYAFYLNKSNAIYQFKKMRADACIKKILNDFGVPIGSITAIPTVIDKIFNDVAVSDIIKEILEMAERARNTKYRMEMRQGKLYIEPQKDLVIKAHFRMYPDGMTYDSQHAIANPSKKRSIADMVNAIQVVGNDDKLVHSRTDAAKVSKYGKLQKVVQLDQEEKRSAAVIAQNELNKLSKIAEDVSLDLIGDDTVRAGRLMDIEEPVTGITGRYLVTDANHTITGGHHTMSLGLEARK